MAITNAQQARQLYKNGGTMEDISFSIVKPSKDGKRPGYFSGLYGGGAGDRGGDPHASAGENYAGGYTDSGNVGNQNQFENTNLEKLKKEAEQIAKEKEDAAAVKEKAFLEQERIKSEHAKKEKERLAKEKRKENTTPFGTVKDYFSKIKNKTIQKALDRNKLLAMKKLNLTKTLNPFAKVPDWAKNYTEEDLMQIATSGPYLGLQKTKADVSKFSDGKDLLGRVFEGQSILDTGNFPQSEYERLFPSNLNVGGGGGGGSQQQTDPCKGPNPPAYCNVGDDDDDDTTTPDRNLGGLAPRFAGSIFDFTGLADGGIARAGAMDGGRMMMMANQEEDDPTGGIMDLESGRQMYFLGKLVKKATRAVKKIVKSPIGKAALLYFGGNALAGKMGGFGGLKGKFFGLPKQMIAGPVKGLLGTGSSGTMGILGKLGLTKGGGSYMPTAMGGILGTSLITGLMTPKEEDDDSAYKKYMEEMKLDIPALRGRRNLAAAFDGSTYNYEDYADGGRIGYAEGSEEPVAKKTMPLLDMDGQEMDLREEGGFVPLGRMERADDVPARLSKNEFVFTADAVRSAGEGDIDKGAEVMYNMMKNLESGGEVSEESQGLDGAREMFKTSQRLEEVL